MPDPRRRYDEGDMAMLIGQLVEATQAASRSIDNLGKEARENATALAAAIRSLEIVQDAVDRLNRIVRDEGDDASLLGQVRTLKNNLHALTGTLDQFGRDMAQIHEVVGDYKTQKSFLSGGRAVALVVVAALAWLTSTVIAVYEAVKK